MTITAIILNYNNYYDLKNCIISLLKQKLPENYLLNIIIIDNNSIDNSTFKIQKEFPQLIYIYNNENKGFAKGVNQGIDFAIKESDYFLLVNNDAELELNCLNILIEKSNDRAITGPVIMYKENKNVVWQGGGFFSKLRMNVIVPDKNKTNFKKRDQSVDFLSGCVLLIPKRALELTGKFDEDFFFYGEDLDFCLRAKKENIKIIYTPTAQAWHNIKNIAINRTNPFVLENLAFSYILILKKHFPKYKVYGVIIFLFIYCPFRMYQIIKGGNKLINIRYYIKGGIKSYLNKI